MQVMTEREEPRRLAGFVQIDEAYLGGERNGGKPGRGSENKQPFVMAMATDEALLMRTANTFLAPFVLSVAKRS